jgi:hypothetical protein
VVALANERAGYMRAGKPERALAVDAELQHHGWAVDANGELCRPKPVERVVVEKRPEVASRRAPREKRA